jgi:hypothetical protein
MLLFEEDEWEGEEEEITAVATGTRKIEGDDARLTPSSAECSPPLPPPLAAAIPPLWIESWSYSPWGETSVVLDALSNSVSFVSTAGTGGSIRSAQLRYDAISA